MDALVLPALGILIVIFLIYIWVAWLSDKNGRALAIDEDDEDDSGSPEARARGNDG